jgi:hypothetical protein
LPSAGGAPRYASCDFDKDVYREEMIPFIEVTKCFKLKNDEKWSKICNLSLIGNRWKFIMIRPRFLTPWEIGK